MNRPVWNRWVLANAIGGVVSLVPGVVLGVLTAGSGAGFGLATGIFQWRALRKLGSEQIAKDQKHAFIWVGATVLGSLLPGWMMFFAGIMGGSNGGVPVRDVGGYIGGVTAAASIFAGGAGLICGIGVGLIQLLVLRAFWPHASRFSLLTWVGATTLGWLGTWAIAGAGLGLVVTSGASSGAFTVVQLITGFLLLAASWTFNGVVTGSVLHQLEAGPTSSSPSATGAVVS